MADPSPVPAPANPGGAPSPPPKGPASFRQYVFRLLGIGAAVVGISVLGVMLEMRRGSHRRGVTRDPFTVEMWAEQILPGAKALAGYGGVFAVDDRGVRFAVLGRIGGRADAKEMTILMAGLPSGRTAAEGESDPETVLRELEDAYAREARDAMGGILGPGAKLEFLGTEEYYVHNVETKVAKSRLTDATSGVRAVQYALTTRGPGGGSVRLRIVGPEERFDMEGMVQFLFDIR